MPEPQMIILTENSSDGYFIHGVFQIPENETPSDALKAVERIRQQVIDNDPEGWNYEDVFKSLKDNGFHRVSWLESCE